MSEDSKQASASADNHEKSASHDVQQLEGDAEAAVRALAREAAIVAFEEVEAHVHGFASAGSAASGTEMQRIAKMLAELKAKLGLEPKAPLTKGAAAK